ncbi:MAG TPA: cation:proton antiporter, partial [Chloroflexota bacterium]|nr:cation:proton antiporter [Chloroflexota bacterium]
MQGLSEQQLLLLLITLGGLILLGRAAGALARRVHQPEVLGQLLAGVLVGPSVFGMLLPTLHRVLFSEPAVGTSLSAFSWVGAILLLLLGGLEVDLPILRATARTGLLAAAGAIVSSLVAGTLVGWLILGQPPQAGFFLGVVLSVTSVSVLTIILLERGMLRRDYAQVTLAVGIASEVLAFILISIAASLGGASPLQAGVGSALTALGVVLFVLTLGRRVTFWALRGVADRVPLARGPLSLVLVLTFLAGALTHGLGLHPLLGAFLVGMLLRGAPRVSPPLLQNVETVTIGLFAPVFFVLAGMRVDLTQLGGPSALLTIALLLAVALTVKIVFGALGARAGRLSWRESALVGMGVCLRGGTDVIVAIIGTELGLLSASLYTMYVVVAMLSVVILPPLMKALAAKAPPSRQELARLRREEIAQRSYLQGIQRVLIPLTPSALPALAVTVLARLAAAQRAERGIFDVTGLAVGWTGDPLLPDDAGVLRALGAIGVVPEVQVTQRHVVAPDAQRVLCAAAGDHDLVIMGARPPQGAAQLSFGALQDQLVRDACADILLVVRAGDSLSLNATDAARRLLVPVNGLAHALAAGDVAAALARGDDAEVMLLHVVPPATTDEADEAAAGLVRDLAARLALLGIRVDHRVRVDDHPGRAILCELERARYEAVVVGGRHRGGT